MQYKKITSGNTIIEFHNNWLGEETVIVNGQVVSKKSSIWGTNHYFAIPENGADVKYILTSKLTDGMQVALDLIRNGELVQENVPVPFGSRPKKPVNKAKKRGLAELKEYALEEALAEFEQALEQDPKDPEIYFHMACAHSVLENTSDGFSCLKKAVENGLADTEMILNHDMLAFIRINAAFEDFLNSGFTEYDEGMVAGKKELGP